jgi:thymidylate kinase
MSLEVRSEYASVFQALAEREIHFCLLRNDLAGDVVPGDLDLLVDDERFDEVLPLLASLGYRVKTTERAIPFKTALVKYVAGSFVVLDLHRRLVQDGIVFMDHREVLARRRAEKDYFLPADADLLIILLYHNVLGKRRIQDKHYPEIRRLLESSDRETLESILADNGTRRVFDGLVEELELYHREPSRVERVRAELLQALNSFDRRQGRRGVAWKIRRWLGRHDPRPRGKLYVLLGVDGSGKSSLTNALIEALEAPGGFSVVSIYMGPWGSYNLEGMRGAPYVPRWSLTTGQWMKAMFSAAGPEKPTWKDVLRVTSRTLTGAKFSEMERDVHRLVRERSRFYLTLRYLRSQVATARFFVMLTAEMLVRYAKVYRCLRRRKIVVADRYIYDLMAGGMHQVIPHYRRIRSLMCRLFFKPDRVFLLRNDPETILARKKDLSEEMLIAFQGIYDQMAEQYGFEVITTDRPPRELARGIVERHFDELIASIRR